MRSLPPSHQQRCLTTSVSAATLALFTDRQQDAVIGSEVLGVSSDWCCWVLSYRVDTTEHRLFVPLVGREARELIECSRQGRVGLLFTSCDDAETFFEAQVPICDADRATLLRHWRTKLESSAPDRLLQTMDILLSVEDDQVSSVRHPPLNVTVTIVLPEDLQRELSDLMPEFPFG